MIDMQVNPGVVQPKCECIKAFQQTKDKSKQFSDQKQI